MAAFATAEDLATYIQRDLSAAETATATQALDIASDLIRTYTGQTIAQVTADSITLTPLYGNNGTLLLPQIPVTAITSVTEDGTVLVLTDEYAWTPAGVLYRIAAMSWTNPVVVVYTHGFATIPFDIRGVCLSLASGMMSGGSGGEIQAEAVGNYQVTYATASESSSGLGAMERAILDRYKA